MKIGSILLLLAACAHPPAMTLEHHSINYIEFAAPDLDQVKRFYQQAFGWKFTDYGPEYSGIQKTGGGEVGGIRQEAEVVQGGPLVILYSADLEQSQDAVQAAGGRIVKAIFAFPGGRRFHFEDPAGNELAVWSDR